MNGNAEVGAEWEVMKRIIALLFALARRADSAACASFPVRCLVLWVLRRCEPIAFDYLGDAHAPLPFWRNSRADALRLAKIFRMAGRAAQAELRQERRLLRKGQSAARTEDEGANRSASDLRLAVLPDPDVAQRCWRSVDAGFRLDTS